MTDLVAAAVAELYAGDPGEFTDRRKALAAAARGAGDAAAARQIGALRKPTRAAWVLNRLARADPAAPGRLAALATALRAAEQAEDGPRLRALSAARGPLIDALTGQALAAAGVADAPAGLRDEVAATLTAALADPEVAAGLAAGTLTHAAQWAGFGAALPSPPADGEQAGTAPPVLSVLSVPEAAVFALPVPERASRPQPQPGGPRAASGSGETSLLAEDSAPEHGRPPAAARERAQQQAAEAAEAAARRRKIFEDAERAVASAAAAAAAAVAAEDRLEEEVRDLEQRLTRARADLADARLRARRAEAADRKARQALDRLPRPGDDAPHG